MTYKVSSNPNHSMISFALGKTMKPMKCCIFSLLEQKLCDNCKSSTSAPKDLMCVLIYSP